MAIRPLSDVLSETEKTIDTLFSYLDAQGQGDYLGEAVSQLEHSLQCASLAVEAGADSDTVLAALLHDVGRFIPRVNIESMPPEIAPDGTFLGHGGHEIQGEKYLRGIGFSDKVCRLVGSHVWAKRYLTATDKLYYDTLSKTSKISLKYQGGPFDQTQVEKARQDPWLEEALAVRKWDDLAKDPAVHAPGLDAYKSMAVENLYGSRSHFVLHERTYQLPQCPIVAVCVDGFDPEYLQHGIRDGILPNMKKICEEGFHATAHAAMPTFTNPNNCSIITGAPTSKHGIAGNFYLDGETGEEKLVLDDTLLRGSTILEQLSKRGYRVAAITAKDKLRRIIQHGLDAKKGDICFSSEYAGKCTLEENGIENVETYVGRPAPPQYSGDLSLYVLDAGVKLLSEGRADVFYLTLSDFIQHKYAPGSNESNQFLSAVDNKIGRLMSLGAIVGITGDHGMSDKCGDDGRPNILFVQDELEEEFGKGVGRVICPITDPFVRHHGALGSFVRIHLSPSAKSKQQEIMKNLRSHPQVSVALDGPAGAEKFEMPLDREGDIVVVSAKNAVLGSTKGEHDLSNITDHRLRSHGGLSEQDIPLLMSVAMKPGLAEQLETREWRNFDVFDILMNWSAGRAIP